MINNQLMYLGGYVAGMLTWMIIVVIAVAAVHCITKPRKPYCRKPKDPDEDISYACPRCGGTVGVYDIEDNYCSDCGQKIDWRKRSE